MSGRDEIYLLLNIVENQMQLPSVINPLLISIDGSVSYSAGNSVPNVLPTDTAPVALPQLCHYAAPLPTSPLHHHPVLWLWVMA